MTPSTPLPEQGGFNERLDNVLWAIANKYDPDTNEPYPQMSVPEARTAIRSLIAEEIIGEDVYWNKQQRRKFSTNDIDSFAHLFAVNTTLADQRKKLGFTANKEDGGER